jgi:hypothetical protein
MQTEAQVRPGEQQEDRLARDVGRVRPQLAHDALVVDVVLEQVPVEPRADDVRYQQQRDGEAERELRRLPPRHAQRAALVERREREEEMD